jgi:hypothetical protein
MIRLELGTATGAQSGSIHDGEKELKNVLWQILSAAVFRLDPPLDLSKNCLSKQAVNQRGEGFLRAISRRFCGTDDG